ETQRRLRQREMEVAKVARQYRKQNGHLDEGFYDALQNYADTHPLFPKEAPASVAPPTQPPPQQPGAAEPPPEEEASSPDDNLPAVEGAAPADREAFVTAHPEAAQQFFEHYHYLPKDVPYPRVVPRR
ncbi:MAG TPA: hypothetical protein VKO87_12675, partial [Gemmatimonadaceae bacterium]|nr:hypothetical protein [Gemmatimonadaceae bacterium]